MQEVHAVGRNSDEDHRPALQAPRQPRRTLARERGGDPQNDDTAPERREGALVPEIGEDDQRASGGGQRAAGETLEPGGTERSGDDGGDHAPAEQVGLREEAVLEHVAPRRLARAESEQSMIDHLAGETEEQKRDRRSAQQCKPDPSRAHPAGEHQRDGCGDDREDEVEHDLHAQRPRGRDPGEVRVRRVALQEQRIEHSGADAVEPTAEVLVTWLRERRGDGCEQQGAPVGGDDAQRPVAEVTTHARQRSAADDRRGKRPVEEEAREREEQDQPDRRDRLDVHPSRAELRPAGRADLPNVDRHHAHACQRS